MVFQVVYLDLQPNTLTFAKAYSGGFSLIAGTRRETKGNKNQTAFTGYQF